MYRNIAIGLSALYAQTTTEVGNLNIIFNGCGDAIAEFGLLGNSISGSTELTRISGSAVPFCESLK